MIDDHIDIVIANEAEIMSLYQTTSFDDAVREIPRGAPRLGEHTDDVLAEIGYSPERILALRAGGVAGSPGSPRG